MDKEADALRMKKRMYWAGDKEVDTPGFDLGFGWDGPWTRRQMHRSRDKEADTLVWT